MNKPSDVTKMVLKKSKKLVFFRFLISLVYRGLAMIIPLLLSSVIDNATNGLYRDAMITSLIAIFVVLVFRMFDIINTYSWHKLYNSMYDNYTRIGVNKVFDNSIYSLSRFNIGEFLNMMSTDINVMSDFYCNLIMRLIRIFEVLIIFVYFFVLDFYIGITGVFVSLISLIIIFLSSEKIEKLNQNKSIKFDNRNTIINEFLASIREIKAFNIFDAVRKRIDTSSDDYTSSYLKQRVGEDVFKYSVLSLIEVSRWLMVIYGIYLISIGKLEIGSLLIIYNYFTQLLDGFSEFATINTGIRQLKVSEKRFYQLIIYSHEKLLNNKKYRFKKYNIKFNEVLYGDRTNPKLKNVTFNIYGNSINSIVENRDSTKSGVVELLLKLNSQHSGTIMIDDLLISDIGFENYYNIVSSIDKDDKFLNISIKENLNIMNNKFELAIHLCKTLGIHNDILQLKDGYDTVLNSSDDTLNANTKLLLNIVRILLKNTKIMVFDEVLCSLNNESRVKVLKLLEDIKKDHTVIVVDKISEVLTKADNVVFISNGEMIIEGSHEELLNNDLYKYIIEN